MNAGNFYPMNKRTKIEITGTPSGFITCGLPQERAAVSDTPRTDNSVVETDWLGTRVELVNADFARKLERELALRAKMNRDLMAENDRLRPENTALRAENQSLTIANESLQQAHRCDLDRRFNIGAALRRAEAENAALRAALRAIGAGYLEQSRSQTLEEKAMTDAFVARGEAQP